MRLHDRPCRRGASHTPVGDAGAEPNRIRWPAACTEPRWALLPGAIPATRGPIAADSLVGTKVRDGQDKVASAIIKQRGTMGMGGTEISVPWDVAQGTDWRFFNEPKKELTWSRRDSTGPYEWPESTPPRSPRTAPAAASERELLGDDFAGTDAAKPHHPLLEVADEGVLAKISLQRSRGLLPGPRNDEQVSCFPGLGQETQKAKSASWPERRAATAFSSSS
jgi:hypothetical protein